MDVYLTSGAISKLSTGACTENDLKPVLQVFCIISKQWVGLSDNSMPSNEGKQMVGLSDGSFWQVGLIPDDIFISNKLQKGSVLQLTKFQFIKRYDIASKSAILCFDLIVIHSECGIIGRPKLLIVNETPLVKRVTPTIPDEDHANSHHVEEPPTTTQKQDHVEEPPTSTQKCSSHSPTQNKKRKFQSSDDAISVFGKDISNVMKMIVDNTIEDGLGPCYKKLVTLEADVSKMKRMMMGKNKEVDVGFKKVETLEENVSKMEKMITDKNKEYDVGACFKKLETLKQDVSKLTRMMMEKNNEDVVGLKKLETLEQDVSKLTRMMMDKNNEDDIGACFKKLETLEQDVSKLTRMMMDKNNEDDMGACIEKLDKMGWGAQEPIYDTALLLFGQSADYRKLWLHLKPESCGKWVKNAGSMFGLLD